MSKEPKVYLKKLAIAAGNYNKVSGNTIAIEPHPGANKSEVRLRIHMTNNTVCGLGYYTHRIALIIIKALTHYEGSITNSINGRTYTTERFIATNVAQPTNDVRPLFFVHNPSSLLGLTKDRLIEIINSCSHKLLKSLLDCFIDTITENYPAGIVSFLSHLEKCSTDFNTLGCFKTEDVDDLRAILSHNTVLVRKGIDKEYDKGNNIFPPIYKLNAA